MWYNVCFSLGNGRARAFVQSRRRQKPILQVVSVYYSLQKKSTLQYFVGMCSTTSPHFLSRLDSQIAATSITPLPSNCNHLTSLFLQYIERQKVVPFGLEQKLKPIIQEVLTEGEKIFLSNDIQFPIDLLHQLLKILIQFFSDIEDASLSTIHGRFIYDPLDLHIKKKINEILETRSASQETLFTQALLKALDERIYPLVIKHQSLPWKWLLFMLFPILKRLLPSFIPSIMASSPRENKKDPFIETLKRGCSIFFYECIEEFKNALKNAPPPYSPTTVHVDPELVSVFLGKQMNAFTLATCTTQSEIQHTTMKGSLDQLQTTVEQKAFNEVSRVLDEVLSILWHMIESPIWRQKKIERLYELLLEKTPLPPSPSPGQSAEDIQPILLNREIVYSLEKTTKAVDIWLSSCAFWSSLKKMLGEKNTVDFIQTTVEKIIAFIGKKGKRFWDKPYTSHLKSCFLEAYLKN